MLKSKPAGAMRRCREAAVRLCICEISRSFMPIMSRILILSSLLVIMQLCVFVIIGFRIKMTVVTQNLNLADTVSC